MPGVQLPPKPRRYDIGNQHFTAPVSEDDRDGDSFSDSNAAAIQDLSAYGPYGYDPYGMGYLGPYLEQTSPWLAEGEESWGDVTQTTLETLESSGLLQRYGEDAVLVIANGPEDMRQLDHEAEAQNIASSRGADQETVVLWNPSPEAMAAMLREGGFRDVVFSGHGEQGQVYMTGPDGTAVAVDGALLAEMFADTEVQNVFLNVCHGAGGQDSVANAFAEAGMNAMGWLGSVGDSEAVGGAAEWAARTADGADAQDLHDTAAAYGGGQLAAVDEHPATPAPEPAAHVPAPVAEPVIPDLYAWDSMNYMWV